MQRGIRIRNFRGKKSRKVKPDEKSSFSKLLTCFSFQTFFFLVSDLTISLLFLTPEKDRASYRNLQLNLNENHVKLFSSLMEHKLSKLTLERNNDYDLLSLVLIQLYLLKVNLLIMVR